MMYKQSFVMYESVHTQFERLNNAGKIAEANRYIDAVMRYGLFGELPEDDDEVWLFGLDNVIASIDSAKSKYHEKIRIPEDELREYLEQGLTQKEIAEKFSCSVDTIQRRIKSYGLNRLMAVPQRPQKTEEEITEKGRNYHSHYNSPSPSLFHSDYEEKIRELGF